MRYSFALLLCFFFSVILRAQKHPFTMPGYPIPDAAEAESLRIAVMSTGEYDHCGFSAPQWMAKKWSDKRSKDKEGNIARKRKWVIRITSPDANRCTLVYGWVFSRWNPEERAWHFAGIEEEVTSFTVDCKTGIKI